jgi:putative transposase
MVVGWALEWTLQVNLPLRALKDAIANRQPPPGVVHHSADRALWVWLSRLWTEWRSALIIVKPETVIGWHRQGFRLHWRWKSRHPAGRPSVSGEVRDLVHRMSLANPRWGSPRIHGELLNLGSQVSQATVAKYMVRHRKPPSQNWRTFLKNHMQTLISADFFVVPTITFRVLFVLVVLSHDRRRPIHFAVTAHPTSEWTAQQLLEAFPWDGAPRYLLRDRDGVMARSSTKRQSGWAFAKSSPRRSRLGKILTWSGWSDRFAASA